LFNSIEWQQCRCSKTVVRKKSGNAVFKASYADPGKPVLITNTGFISFVDGSVFKEITLEGYLEGH